MGIWAGLKRTLNIGGCFLTIRTEQRSYPQGASIRGEVSLRGGDIDQTADSLAITLDEFWTESRGSGKNSRRVTVHKTRDRKLLKGKLTILPGGELSFPFVLRLPLNSRLSTSSTGWRLQAIMDIPGAVDPQAALVVKVHEAVALRAVAEACGNRIEFREKKGSWHWVQNRYTSFRMLPSEAMKAEFDHLDVRLTMAQDGSLRGNVIFDLQEKSFKDYCKALFGMDTITKAIALSPEQIFQPDGSANCDAIEKLLAPLIADIVALRNPDLHPPPLAKEDRRKIRTEPLPSREKKGRDGSRTKSAPPREFDPKRLDY